MPSKQQPPAKAANAVPAGKKQAPATAAKTPHEGRAPAKPRPAPTGSIVEAAAPPLKAKAAGSPLSAAVRGKSATAAETRADQVALPSAPPRRLAIDSRHPPLNVFDTALRIPAALMLQRAAAHAALLGSDPNPFAAVVFAPLPSDAAVNVAAAFAGPLAPRGPTCAPHPVASPLTDARRGIDLRRLSC